MKLVAVLLALFVAVAALVVLKRRGALAGSSEPWPFYPKKPLTQPEQVLYHRLVAALPDHIVLAQVQLSRVLGVKKGSRQRGQVLQNHVLLQDLTLEPMCDPGTVV